MGERELVIRLQARILVHHQWISAQTDNKLGTDIRIIRHAIRTREVWKPCRRSGWLASSSAIERRVYCGPAPRLPARRSSGNCQGAQEPTGSLLQAVDIVVPSGCES